MINLIDLLIEDGWLRTPKIIEAFRQIKRADFLGISDNNKLKNKEFLAEMDEPLPIGYGQTISQPLVVAFMIEQLKPKEGDKILDIGSGSGWTTAILSYIVNPTGKVIALEIIPDLKEFGEKNVSKYNFVKSGVAKFICADGSTGYKKESPFDSILVSASSEKVFQSWNDQLKIGGRIVAPIKSSIWVFTKKTETEFKEVEYPGFSFVPLVTKNDNQTK